MRNYTYAKYGREVLKQPGHVAYQIYDAQVRPMLRKEYDLEEATFYKADTLGELASLLPVNQTQFLKTIEEYNSAVQDGSIDPQKDGKGTKGITPPKSTGHFELSKVHSMLSCNVRNYVLVRWFACRYNGSCVRQRRTTDKRSLCGW